MPTFIIPDNGDDLARLIRLDVDTSCTTSYTSTPTDHPIEAGSNVSDHVVDEPDEITIEGFISNEPLFSNPRGIRGSYQSTQLNLPKYERPIAPTPGAVLNAGLNAIGDLLADAPPAQIALKFPTAFNAPSETEEALDTLRLGHVLCQVLTSTRRHDNMIITSFEQVKSAADGTGATYSINLRKITIVESLAVAAPVLPEEPRGMPAGSQGTKAVKEVEDEQAAKETIAHQLIYGGGAGKLLEGLGL